MGKKRERLNPCVPLISAVGPEAAFASAVVRKVGYGFDAHDELRLLVAELALHAQTHGRAVLHGQRRVVQGVREDGLFVVGVHEIDALIVFVAVRIVVGVVGAVEDDVARFGFQFGAVQQRREARAGPFAIRQRYNANTPLFDLFYVNNQLIVFYARTVLN